VSTDAFAVERDQLLAGLITSPVSELCCCYRRSWGPEKSLFELVMARRADSLLKISLYPRAAADSTRPIWEFFVDPLIDIERIPQGSVCSVVGELGAGRAVLVRLPDYNFECVSLTGLRMPLRGKRFGRRR
jgi:hypothetical protein